MKLFKIAALCLLLGACVFGTSKNSTFYTLTSQETEALSDKNLHFVGINRIQLPKYMDRPQIVTQSKDKTEMVLSEYNRWIESPSLLTTRVLVENLSALLPKTQIKTNPFGTEKFDRLVSVEVLNMNAILGGRAELTVWYTIKNATGQTSVRQKFTDTIRIGSSYDDMAKGYSELWMKLSRQIANSLIK
ncbi:MAG: membrane integrity-associated transporter subunit PqiC [Alphaproteobacteria bacterium]|nr:membrane integrity-associated transporter subunit PqiC [Alphaproteobacteria bacterium]